MLSWVHDEIATHSPILNINTAEPESGKIDDNGADRVSDAEVHRSVEASEAAIYRAIKRWQPLSASTSSTASLPTTTRPRCASVINSGHTRGQGVLRCLGTTTRRSLFSTFAPKAIGMVGRKLPPATLSRCIFVELRRRKKDEPSISSIMRTIANWPTCAVVFVAGRWITRMLLRNASVPCRTN